MRVCRFDLWWLGQALFLGIAVATAIGLAAPRRGLAQGAEEGGKKIALLIGVNKYENRKFRDLEYAERDVEALADVLGPGGYEVKLLTSHKPGDDRATLANIQKALNSVLTKRTKRDLILVALAGHGFQIEVAGADGKLQSDSYYCPVDAVQGEPKTMLAMAGLFAEIDRRGGGRNLVLVDACREDPTRGRGMDGGTVKTLPEGLAVFFGCRAGQKTFESKGAGGGHGVFFHFVLEGLRGKAINEEGEVTWGRLTEYVAKRVKNDTPGLVGDPTINQTPNLIANLGDSPVLLVPPKPIKRGPPPALLVAPFSESAAKSRQLDWARHFGKTSAVEENSLKMRLALVPPGEFEMGGTFEDEQRHRVRIRQPFYLGVYEVTVGQFRQFAEKGEYTTDAEKIGGFGFNPTTGKVDGPRRDYTWKKTGFDQDDEHPVVNVSWNDADAFCKWLSQHERRTYRLPTEAEWEYACRAGTTTAYQQGEDPASLVRVANLADATARQKLKAYPAWSYVAGSDGYAFTAPVGKFRANAFGLYDMHGNVWEWCHDWYREDYQALPTDDPRNDQRALHRLTRGGSWSSKAEHCRSAHRGEDAPTNRAWDLGFRVVLEVSR